jgi:transposase-like protein
MPQMDLLRYGGPRPPHELRSIPSRTWRCRRRRTTNVIVRAFREVRRRTRPMSSFSNVESCDRIVYGVISHLNRSWERKALLQFTQTC